MAEIFPGGYLSHTLGKDVDWCLRMAYYRVYGCWGGWDPKSDPTTRELYTAKQARNLQMHAGVLVHDIAKKMLELHRGGRVIPSNDKVIARSAARFMEDIAYSESGRWKKLWNPKKGILILREHFMGQDLDPDAVKTSKQVVIESTTALVEHWIPKLLEDGPETWQTIDSIDRVEHAGYTLFIVPDLLQSWYPEELRFNILDWKTGKYQDHDQIVLYALYVIKKWRQLRGIEVPLSALTGMSVPLRADPATLEHTPITEEKIQETLTRIDRQVLLLKGLDPAGKKKDKTPFPKTEDRSRCDNCTYCFHCEYDD